MAYITHIGNAVPTYEIPQAQAADFMVKALALDEKSARKLNIIYRATRIQKRYSVLSDFITYPQLSFFPETEGLVPFPSTAQRMKIYQQHAANLGQAAVADALPDNFPMKEITHLITVSCTGMYAPGLDIDLVKTLGLKRNVQRTCINFMGCYASFNALKSAQAICTAFPEAKVLIVGVELCTLHFQKKQDDDQLLANALFADGAAAALVQGRPSDTTSLKLDDFYCDLISEGEEDMAWHIGDVGFEMRLSSYVPKLLSANIQQILAQAFQHFQVDLSAINQFAIHPGGRAILDGLSTALDVPQNQFQHSYEVLANYGNMSSVTILFVLKRLLHQAKAGEKILTMAFGPGLTLESGVLSVV